MPPISHRDLIRRLHNLGFEGPFVGGKHSFMIRQNIRLTLPNPHKGDISKGLLKRILRQAGITEAEWNKTP
ncbi:MAG: type II toxin-antitoxin system HicA family toxin [Ignavibacteriales bacterium]|nr:type II toxin-antitoxin system HicA family toxin [Ignavibacteriales bacterium]